jgi:hypothetical protein
MRGVRDPGAALCALAALAGVLLAGACNKSLVVEEDAQITDLPPLVPAEPASREPAEGASREPALAPAPATSPRADVGAGRADAGSDGGAKARGGALAEGGAGGDGGVCGDPPLRDCPLKAWMKANSAPAVMAQDLDALAAAFDRIATFAPMADGGKGIYENWVSIANDGADAARSASMVGVKGACRGCHQQYKEPYKAAMRARALL